MPLPRFLRLPADRQAQILRVARSHFAEQGVDAASYNRIISAAQISKTSAYLYFDGRADLLQAVLADVRERLLLVLGPWVAACSPEGFWEQFAGGGVRLLTHLVQHPDDRALADSAMVAADSDFAGAWLGDVVANARELGLVRDDIDPDLLLAATAGVVRAADRWVLALPEHPPPDAPAQLQRLLAGLWGGPTREELAQ